MARYKAPEQVTQIFLSSGVLTVDDKGFVEAPDDMPLSDITELCGAGFVPAPLPAKSKDAAKDA